MRRGATEAYQSLKLKSSIWRGLQHAVSLPQVDNGISTYASCTCRGPTTTSITAPLPTAHAVTPAVDAMISYMPLYILLPEAKGMQLSRLLVSELSHHRGRPSCRKAFGRSASRAVCQLRMLGLACSAEVRIWNSQISIPEAAANVCIIR